MQQRILWYVSLILLAVFAAGGVIGQAGREAKAAPGSKERQRAAAVRPDGLNWRPIFDGVEAAVIEGDPATAGARYVARVRMRDGARVSLQHAGAAQITVMQGVWAADGDAAREFPAGSYVAADGDAALAGTAKGETIIQIQATGPLRIIQK